MTERQYDVHELFFHVNARPNESSTNECFVPAISHNNRRHMHEQYYSQRARGEYCAVAGAVAVAYALFTFVLVVFHFALCKMLSSTNRCIEVSVLQP